MLPTSIIVIDSSPKPVSAQYIGQELSSWQINTNYLFGKYTT